MKYKYTNPSYNGVIAFPDNKGDYQTLLPGQSIILEEDYSSKVKQHRIIIEQIIEEKNKTTKTNKQTNKYKEED